ncbi:MAG: DUF2851 family protein [Flavobacteriaceae bacterium]|nr:DUF2851 family protein [Flavobacteriaceae bacterium]
MKENFLHYIWLYQLYQKTDLISTSGESIQIEKAGHYTEQSGPDFKNAKIRIQNQLWAGNVEIHLKSSDWYVHHHETDPAYDNVILHVVWEDDMPVFRRNQTIVSTLELKGRVSAQLLQNFDALFNTPKFWIPCEKNLKEVDPFVWQHWLERLYVERLHQKTEKINVLLEKFQYDWEGVLFVLLAQNFGLNINSEAFYQMALTLDWGVLRKERENTHTLEALFMGQTGLLFPGTECAYQQDLFQIFTFQKHKYNLQSPLIFPHYFRLRPPNFPNIRLSQLADLWSRNQHLFHELTSVQNLSEYYKLLECKTATYWETHYVFGKEHRKTLKKTSHSFLDLLLINTVIPMQFAYLNYKGNTNIDYLLDVMKQIASERNSVVDSFVKQGLKIENAMQSQALLTLKKEYCSNQKCLQCEVGLHILKRK